MINDMHGYKVGSTATHCGVEKADGCWASDAAAITCPECRAAIQRAWGGNKVVQITCSEYVVYALRADGRVFEIQRSATGIDDSGETTWLPWKALPPVSED